MKQMDNESGGKRVMGHWAWLMDQKVSLESDPHLSLAFHPIIYAKWMSPNHISTSKSNQSTMINT